MLGARAVTARRPVRILAVEQLTSDPLAKGSRMANYLLVFRGGSMPQTPEEQAQVMKAWTDWFAELGDALADGGNPAS